MIFLSDENLEVEIVNQLRRHLPSIDIIDVRDVGLAQTPDEDILQWAAENGRVIISRDVNSMRRLAYQRVEAGLPMPGVIIVLEHIPFGWVIQWVIRYAVDQFADIEGQVVYVKEL